MTPNVRIGRRKLKKKTVVKLTDYGTLTNTSTRWIQSTLRSIWWRFKCLNRSIVVLYTPPFAVFAMHQIWSALVCLAVFAQSVPSCAMAWSHCIAMPTLHMRQWSDLWLSSRCVKSMANYFGSSTHRQTDITYMYMCDKWTRTSDHYWCALEFIRLIVLIVIDFKCTRIIDFGCFSFYNTAICRWYYWDRWEIIVIIVDTWARLKLKIILHIEADLLRTNSDVAVRWSWIGLAFKCECMLVI